MNEQILTETDNNTLLYFLDKFRESCEEKDYDVIERRLKQFQLLVDSIVIYNLSKCNYFLNIK